MPLFAPMVTGHRALIFGRQSAYTGIVIDRIGPTNSAEGLSIMTVAPPAAGVCRLSAVVAGIALVVAVAHAAPAVAESAALYEQQAGDAPPKRYVGSVTWNAEQEPAAGGGKPALALRGDIVVPERHLAASFLLRRNTDRALPATHTIEITFKLSPDFPGHGVASIAGVMLKPNDQAHGTPLAGLVAKIVDGYFLFGLSALEGDATLNAGLLRDGKSLDILMVYGTGTRAILTFEKGASGDQAFKAAFADWEK
jgi:hypothetical protein